MTAKENKTVIEKHHIYSGVPLLGFVESSTRYGTSDTSTEQQNDYLKKAACIEDKKTREFALSLIRTIESMGKSGDELRKRFTTTHNALTEINDQLKTPIP